MAPALPGLELLQGRRLISADAEEQRAVGLSVDLHVEDGSCTVASHGNEAALSKGPEVEHLAAERHLLAVDALHPEVKIDRRLGQVGGGVPALSLVEVPAAGLGHQWDSGGRATSGSS